MNPNTKNLKLHNLIADYSAQVLVRGKQKMSKNQEIYLFIGKVARAGIRSNV